MSVIVEDLLLLARLDEGRPLEREPVDLAEVASEAVETARAVEPDRQIELSVEPARRARRPRAAAAASSTTCSATSARTRPPGRRRR